MKRIVFILFFFPFCLLSAQNDTDSLLNVLDKTINNQIIYSNQKESKINSLKNNLKQALIDSRKYEIYRQLFEEYKSFKSDSALIYAQKELQFAREINNADYITEARLDLSSVMSISVMYREAIDILNAIDINKTPKFKADYYHRYINLYAHMADYTVSTQEKIKYKELSNKFWKLLLLENSQIHGSSVTIKFDYLINQEQYDEALRLLVRYYATLKDDKHTKARIAYCISICYKAKKDRELEKRWLILSAIYDLKSSTKEYISLHALAFMLYEDRDVERAYKYIKRSLEDALFCNARLRTDEIAEILPIIDMAYQQQIIIKQRIIITTLIIVSLLSLLLFIAILFVDKQRKKLVASSRDLNKSNDQLKEVNNRFNYTNKELKKTNNILSETNNIKEVYIGQYMSQCSEYIDKIDNYRRSLNRRATSGKIDELLQDLKSKYIVDNELKEFYNNFDTSFLKLFPDFVKEFRKLLIDDELLQLKPGQLLNTELRIYALIRLGITDGAKIANFLRCSTSTIYNYRTKIRNKAIGNRDEFEKNVLQIGILTE